MSVAHVGSGNTSHVPTSSAASTPETSEVSITPPYSAALTLPDGKAEKHKVYSLSSATSGAVLDAIFDFVENQQSGILRWATDSGTTAVYDGSAFWTSGTPTFGDGSYVVIEPVAEYPGGGRWQLYITSADVSSGNDAHPDCRVAWSGGWSTSNADLSSSECSTLDEMFFSGDLTTDDTLYLSCANADSYLAADGETANYYSYFRLLRHDYSQSASTYKKMDGVYAGGYIPVDTADTKPVVMLRGYSTPRDMSGTWGDGASTTGACPGEYNHSDTNTASVEPGLQTGMHGPETRGGAEVNAPLYIRDVTDAVALGSFGQYTMLAGDSHEGGTDRTALSAWGSHSEYINGIHITFRWKP